MKKSVLTSLIAASALFAGAAVAGNYADEAYATTPAASTESLMQGWYVGAGVNHTANTTAKQENDTTGVESDLETTDYGWNIFVGRNFTESFAFELGYSSYGDNTFENAAGTTTANYYNTWAVTALGKVISPSFYGVSAYLKAGVAYLNQESKVLETEGTQDSQYSTGTLAYGFGLQYNYDRFGVALDWLRFQNNNTNDVVGNSMYFPDEYSLNLMYNF